ncbi:MAG TPA: SpvB/TcaC N-terminal domain-containing protein [Streptosporangiaceae bacterium]|nr:SpvB/TcaC N-terminal domain-containing protein [Streptosporangiaceae bacterium]
MTASDVDEPVLPITAQPPVLGCTTGNFGYSDTTTTPVGGMLQSRTLSRPLKTPTYQKTVDPRLDKSATTVAYKGARLVIGADDVTDPVPVGVTPLAEGEVPPLDAGMENVTSGPEGYQFTPSPYTFEGKIEVSIPYDPTEVGADTNDVRTFYYDELRGCWRPLERLRVDPLNHTVVSLTDHFTDMINATVVVPEHPGAASFNPTQIKDIQAADPGDRVSLIQPPGAANTGEARLSYPLEVPPGRAGLRPNLAVSYASAGANGWLGVGWDLSMQAVTIDTRWGVPRYDADSETETYQLGSEQLTPVAHRAAPGPRVAGKVFHTRTEGSFARITRHGDSPKNYTWEVVDKSGLRWIYGGTPGEGPAADATLADDSGNVFLWALREVRDRNGNTMRYHNVRVNDDGVAAGGSVPGRDLYLQRITYTGRGDTEGAYSVTFVRDRELSEPRRKDVTINARGGFKRVTADLLRRVDVKFSGALVRRYEFDYQTGAFEKTLLKSISQFDENGRLFNAHQFGYFDDIRDAQGRYQAFQQVNWNSPDDNLRNGTVNAIRSGAGEAGALNGNTSSGAGGHLYVGFGAQPSKANSAGVKAGFNRGDDEGLLALMDVDGDDLPDKVFRSGGAVHYRKNLSKPGGEPRFSATAQPLRGLPGIMSGQNDSLTVGVEAYFGAVAAQLNHVDTTSTTDRYFADVNGDGITDLVNGGGVLFGRVGPDGVPVYGVAADTPVPIGGSTVDPNGILGDFTADRERKIDSFPLVDSVRRWVAPFDGTVAITGQVKLLAGDTGKPRFAKPDGVRVAIQHENTELWAQTIAAGDLSAHTPADVNAVQVRRGERLYFRVGSVSDGSDDRVSWDPRIAYTGVPASTDVNGLNNLDYQASRDFTLGGRTGETTVSTDGTLHLGGTLTKSGATTDDITLLITQNGEPVVETSLAAADSGDIAVNKDIEVTRGQKLAWRVRVDSPIDLGKISWTPTAHYTAAPGVDRLFDDEGNPLIKIDPPYDIDMYPGNDLTAPQESFTATSDGTITVNPELTFDFGGRQPDSTVVFTVKRAGGLVAKREITITDGQVSDPADLSVPVSAGQELFFDFSTRDRKLAAFLTAQTVTIDGATAPSAFHRAVDEGAFPQPYRGWAAVGYNGNRDRAGQPIRQTDLALDENFRDGLPSDVDPQRDKDAFTADPRITPPKVFVFTPAPKDNRWQSGEASWIAKDAVASSRLGGQSINLPTTADLAGVRAVPRISRSQQISLTGGVSGGIGSVGGSVATGDSTGELDYLDLNGDDFPDVAGANGVQYSDPTGTLGDTRGALPDGSVRRSHNVSGNASAGSAARTIATGHGQAAPQGNGSANTSRTGNDMPPLGVGGSLGTGASDSRFDLLDINGDQLPDRVYEDGRAALNLGYRFAAPEPWPGGPLNDGESSNNGINIGFNTDFYGFAGGASFGQGDSDSDSSLQDMNGDGLADRVFAGNPIRVALNTGNGFAAPQEFLGSLSGLNNDVNAQVGGGVYFTFSFCALLVTGCIIVNPGADVSTGAGRAAQTLRDLDGDGYADHLASDSDSELSVAQNRTGRTNLLRSVIRPMGSRFDLDYKRDGNTYDQPHSRWVLSEVTINDGQPLDDGPDVQRSTFDYSVGVFDRLEREFYGYRTTVERHHDTANGNTVFSSVTRDYRTDSYYTRGLLERERTADGQGRLFTETENTYRLRDVSTGATPADARSTTATIFPQLVRTDERFFEGQSQPGKTTHIEMAYDDFGNVVRSLDAADTGAADDVDMRFRYTAEDAACRANNIVGAATAIEVRGAGTLMRNRDSTYDCATGNLIRHRAFLADGTAAVTDLTYFDNGNLASVTNPPNKSGQRYKLSYTYDTVVDTHVASVTDSHNLRSTQTYNLKYGLIETTTDVNDQSTVQRYDAVGRVDSVAGPLEIAENRLSIDFEYHPEATVPYAVTRHVDRRADGSVKPDAIDTITFSDGLKRILQTKKDATVSTGPDTAPADVMTVSGRVTFDAFGRTAAQYYQVTEPKGATNTSFNPAFDTEDPTRTTYDVLDRPTRTVLPDDTVTTMAYGFGTDRAGTHQFESVRTDAKGNVKRTYTDVREATTAVKESNPAGGQPAIWTSYAHDPLGQIIRVTDDKNNVTTSTYDNFARRTIINSPDSGRTETVYDLAGNPVRKITAKLAAAGKAIEYDYDFERLSAIRYPLFPASNVAYTYGDPGAAGNGAGRVTAIRDGAGTLTRAYGPLGEVTSETRSVPVQGNKTEEFTTQYRYDTWNRMLRMTFPDGEVLSYGYNSGGLVNQATGVKGANTYQYLRRLDYDKFDQRVLQETGNGTRTRYTYNADDRRLATLESKLEIGYTFQNLSYDYDAVGNVTSIANNTAPPDGPEVGFQLGGPSRQTYHYDDLYRLTHAEGDYTSRGPKTDRYRLDIGYDSIHNITGKNQLHELVTNENVVVQKKTTYNYGYTYGSGKPHAPSVVGPHTMSYDANGNLISRAQQPRPRRQLIWDEENRLACGHENVQSQTLPQDATSCDNQGGAPDARYAYDDVGKRIVKDSSQTHIYPNQNYSTQGNKQFKHVFIGSSKLVTKFVEPDSRFEDRQFYAHADHLGSTGFVTDTEGQLYEHLNYFPTGETWVEEKENPGQPVPHQYTGKELDPETGYYHYGARYYDPRTSVWQSPDPAIDAYLDGSVNGGTRNSANLALYTYSYNNPVRLVDPDGRWVHIAVGAGVGALVGAGIEGYRQYRSGEFSGLRLLGAAAGGGVAGGMGAATFGASALGTGVAARATVYVAREAAANAAGGATEAMINGDNVGQAAGENAVMGAATSPGGAMFTKVLGAVSHPLIKRLKQYKDGGGHHAPSQAAMKDKKGGPNVAGYNPRDVLAIPEDVLKDLGIKHSDIRPHQADLFKAWRSKNPNANLTYDDLYDIEVEAMIRAGANDPDAVRALVAHIIQDHIKRGVAPPGRVPYVDP